MSHKGLEKRWLVLDNPQPRHPQRITHWLESVSTILFNTRTSYAKSPEWGQHSSSNGTPCQVSIFGTIRGRLDLPNGNPGANCRCRWYIFRCCQLRDTVARYADCWKNSSSQSSQMQMWLVHLFLWQKANPAYPTTKCPCSYFCIFGHIHTVWRRPLKMQMCPGYTMCQTEIDLGINVVAE